MGLISKFKILWKIVGFIKEIGKGDSMKAGIKTTEFWGKVAIQILAVVGAISGVIGEDKAIMIAGALEGLYSIARAIVKYKGGNLPPLPQ